MWADPTPGGPVYFSAQSGGKLGILDPKSGKVEAVALGSASQVMLRFDPSGGKFETFKPSSSSPNVRQIHGRKGEVWTPESGADKLVVYRYK